MQVEVASVDDDFGEWVRPHLPVLGAVAARWVGPDDAPDVVQNGLVRAWRRRSTFDAERGTVRAWLLAIVVDQARKHRAARRAAPLIEVPAVAAPDGTRVDVEAVVRSLPQRQREVVALYYLADLSVEEVAVTLGIGVGSVKSHLSAARAALRTKVGES